MTLQQLVFRLTIQTCVNDKKVFLGIQNLTFNQLFSELFELFCFLSWGARALPLRVVRVAPAVHLLAAARARELRLRAQRADLHVVPRDVLDLPPAAALPRCWGGGARAASCRSRAGRARGCRAGRSAGTWRGAAARSTSRSAFFFCELARCFHTL